MVGAGIPDAMASAISNVDMATWVVTSGGPHPECPSVCAREARNRQVWSGILRHAGSRLRLWENVGHDARGETCRPGEREVGAVERTHNFMCSKPLDSRFLRIGNSAAGCTGQWQSSGRVERDDSRTARAESTLTTASAIKGTACARRGDGSRPAYGGAALERRVYP